MSTRAVAPATSCLPDNPICCYVAWDCLARTELRYGTPGSCNMISFLNSGYRQVARKWAHLSIGIVVAAAWLCASSCGGDSGGAGPPQPSAKEALYLSSG